MYVYMKVDLTLEQAYSISHKIACVHSEDSDWPVHPHKAFAVCFMYKQGFRPS